MSHLHSSSTDASVLPAPTRPASDPITEIEFDNVVGYKLSDAIRDGSKDLSHEIGGWGDGVATGCALTAARYAIERKGYGSNK